jgi:hypothetical protein
MGRLVGGTNNSMKNVSSHIFGLKISKINEGEAGRMTAFLVCDFRQGSKVQGPLNSSNLILVESFNLVPRPLDEGLRPKKWQIEAQPSWHLFWRENQLVGTKKTVLKRRAPDLENQESG